MRGLTAEEYEVMQGCLDPEDPDPDAGPSASVEFSDDESAAVDRLVAAGRLTERIVEGAWWWCEVFDATAAGREALRIHEALSALEGVS